MPVFSFFAFLPADGEFSGVGAEPDCSVLVAAVSNTRKLLLLGGQRLGVGN